MQIPLQMPKAKIRFCHHPKATCRLCTAVMFAVMSGASVLANSPLAAGTADTTPLESKRQASKKQANQRTADDSLQRILSESGITAQLSSISPIVIDESREHWQSCNTSDSQLEPWLSDALSASKMTQIATDKLDEALDEQTKIRILEWLDSPSGQTIVQAERLSASLSDEDFEHYFNELSDLPTYQSERAPRIRALINRTLAGAFVSALNTEISGLVSLSIACSPNHDTINDLLAQASNERQDLGLVSAFMNINLIRPTAVVYRHLDNQIVDDYLQFSKSEAGKTYHNALINITRDTLVNRLEALADRFNATAIHAD